MNLKINDIKTSLWHDILEKSSYSSPFQTPDFYNFFRSLDNCSADVFAIEKDNELISLVVVTLQKEEGIKGYFSRRGIIYGGPLFNDHYIESLQLLLKSVIKYYFRRLIYLEIRNYFDYSSVNNIFRDSGFKFVPWINFNLEITSPELMLRNMSNSRARQIKKAIKTGVNWKEAQSEDEVKIFYEILKNLYKNKIKKPLFSFQFFLEFFRQKIGKYLLIYYNDKIIGGIMCPIIHGKAIYEFYVCGLDSEYKEQYPSVMATWAAMEYAYFHNIPLFDFMGAGSPTENYGVRDFKSRFGGKYVEHGRYLKIINPLLYKVGIVGLKILSKVKK